MDSASGGAGEEADDFLVINCFFLLFSSEKVQIFSDWYLIDSVIG